MELTNHNQDRRKSRRQKVDLSTMVYGRVPPQAQDAEKAVLGAIMLEKDAFDVVSEILKPEAFYLDSHQRVYRAFVELKKVGQPVDYITVTMHLAKAGELEIVGGSYYVTELTKDVVSAAHIERHSLAVQEAYMGRELIRISGESITAAYEWQEDIFELLGNHEKQLTELTTGTLQPSFVPADVAVMQSLQRLEILRQQDTDITGTPSGFEDLDRVTCGWQDTDLIILAARPAVGKTAFALNLARNAAKSGKGVGFFSMEMSIGQLTNRLLSIESDVLLERISRGKLDDADYHRVFNEAAPAISAMPLYFDDTAALTILQLASKCRKLKRKKNVGMIIVDYLQLMSGASGKGGNREQEISQISRGLKTLAKELKVPIIALSQLSRAVESRQGEKRMPQLSDLRESGAIEQDADMVMFLYRPEYYEINSNEQGESTKGETHVRIAKHRNGSLETIKLRARLHVQKFEKYEEVPASIQVPLGLPTGDGQRWKPVPPMGGSRIDNDKDLPF